MSTSDQNQQQRRKEIEQLKTNKLKQQVLSNWKLYKSSKVKVVVLLVIAIIFGAVSYLLFTSSAQIKSFTVSYSDAPECKGKKSCEIKLTKDLMTDKYYKKKMEGTVYFYYYIENFFQNHRRFVKSQNVQQLRGESQNVNQLAHSCSPVTKNEDLWDHQKYSVALQKQAKREGNPLSSYKPDLVNSEPAIPCGLIAKAFFNDTYKLQKVVNGKTSDVKIDETGIAWPSDVKYKFKNTKKPKQGKTWEQIQWLDMEKEHFMVWMRTSALPSFRKLWGKIEGGLEEGAEYTVLIQNNYNVENFGGKKSVEFTTLNSLGGDNTYFAYLYLAGCIATTLFMFVSIFASIKYPDQKKDTEESSKDGYNAIN